MLIDGLLCEQVAKKDLLCAGIDEVGRGCLAGPVVACAVILPKGERLCGLADSKTLSPKKRQQMAITIREKAVALGLALVGQRTIDRINILQATLQCMSMAVARLGVAPRLLLIDGNRAIAQDVLARFWKKRYAEPLPMQKTIVQGDSTIPEISAASIVAKVFRDELMVRFSRRWPDYGFERHMGYGSRLHREMLARLGPCILHRRSFHGVVTEEQVPGSLL